MLFKNADFWLSSKDLNQKLRELVLEIYILIMYTGRSMCTKHRISLVLISLASVQFYFTILP